MSHRRGGPLAQVEAGVADNTVLLSSLLQKCIVLGGDAGSEKLRDWARRELNGYRGPGEEVPTYRHVPAPLMAEITSRAGYGITLRIPESAFPGQVRDIIHEKLDLKDAIVTMGVGELEAMASEHTGVHTISPGWGDFIADKLNTISVAPDSHVARVYWAVPNSALRGLLTRIRAALADLVAELSRLTPEDQQVPPKLAADQAIQFVINGNGTSIHYSPQSTAGGGTNLTISGPAAGPTTVAGAHDGHAVKADRDALTTGRDVAVPPVGDPPSEESWWTRLRKRGVVVTLATIIGAIAVVIGTAVAIFTWLGWTP